MRKKKAPTGELWTNKQPTRSYYNDHARRGLDRPDLDTTLFHDADFRGTGILPNTRGERVTEDHVVQILNERGLRCLEDIAPSLAAMLQIMKETSHIEDLFKDGIYNPVRHLRNQLPDVINNIDNLIGDLNIMINAFQGEPEEQYGFLHKEVLEACQMVKRFGGVILQKTNPSPPSTSTAHWHDDAYFLAIVLFEAARDLGKRVSFSKETSAGVVAIAALLGLAKVNHSGAGAIALELKRRRKNESFLG